MKKILMVLLCVSSITAIAGDIYRCGDEYTDKPCGPRVELNVHYPTCDERVKATDRHYKTVISNMEADYRRRELYLIGSMLSAPHVTQITNVRAQSGAHSGASIEYAKAE